MENFKKILNLYLKNNIKKYNKLGVDNVVVHGISHPNKEHYGKIFLDSEPEIIEDSVKKIISDDVYDFLTLINEHGWDWDVFFDKRPLYDLDESLPFKETIKDNSRIRIFKESTDDSEFKWHQDNEDRLVFALHETDWMVQLDDELPMHLEPNKEIFIPEGVWHRLIKGTGDLKVKVVFV